MMINVDNLQASNNHFDKFPNKRFSMESPQMTDNLEYLTTSGVAWSSNFEQRIIYIWSVSFRKVYKLTRQFGWA